MRKLFFVLALLFATPVLATVNLGDNVLDTVAEVDAKIDAKAPIESPTFTGTVGGITKSMVGLGNVDNTTDAGKPVSTATQTALDLKANIESPTFTGTVSVPSKTTAATNTGTLVATEAQTYLKANIASPTFTGTPAAPTATAATSTTQVATTEFVNTTTFTATDGTATNTLVPVAAKTSVNWFNGIRNNLKYLFSSGTNGQVLAKVGTTTQWQDNPSIPRVEIYNAGSTANAGNYYYEISDANWALYSAFEVTFAIVDNSVVTRNYVWTMTFPKNMLENDKNSTSNRWGHVGVYRWDGTVYNTVSTTLAISSSGKKITMAYNSVVDNDRLKIQRVVGLK